MNRPLVLLGAGAFAREVYDWCLQADRTVGGFFASSSPDDTLRGLPVWKDPAEIPAEHAWVAGVGSPPVLRHLAEAVGAIPPAPAVVHPSVALGTGNRIGGGSILCPFVGVSCDVTTGIGAVVNGHAIVGHDVTMGDFVSLAPRATLAGHARVGDGASVGVGATVLPGVRVAAEAIIGAGAVVTRDVDAGVHGGIPARRLRDLRPEETRRGVVPAR